MAPAPTRGRTPTASISTGTSRSAGGAASRIRTAETRAVMGFVRQIQPDVSIWYHQPWGAVLACHGAPQLAAEYAKLVGMGTSCRGKGLRGTAITWEMHTFPGT